MRRLAVYPGTFDPFTYGHLDLLRRALDLFDNVTVLVAQNTRKTPMLDMEKRRELIKDYCKLLPLESRKRVSVDIFDGLLVKYVADKESAAIIRGLRAISDFEYEFQWHGMNSKLQPNIEIVFLMAAEKYQFISSSFVREVCILGGDISQFVSPMAIKMLSALKG